MNELNNQWSIIEGYWKIFRFFCLISWIRWKRTTPPQNELMINEKIISYVHVVTVRNVVVALLCFQRHLWFCSRGGVWQTPPGRPPRVDTPRQTPWADTPQADTPQADTPRQTHPWTVHAGIHTRPAQCMLGCTHPCPVHAGIHTPLPSACWDTHPPAQCMLGCTHPCLVYAGIHVPHSQRTLQRAVGILLECILVCENGLCWSKFSCIICPKPVGHELHFKLWKFLCLVTVALYRRNTLQNYSQLSESLNNYPLMILLAICTNLSKFWVTIDNFGLHFSNIQSKSVERIQNSGIQSLIDLTP